MSEHYLRAGAVSLPNLHLEVRSAGTDVVRPGGNADPRAVAVMQAQGIDISSHETRRFRPQDVEWFDLIIAMDKATIEKVVSCSGLSSRYKFHLFGIFSAEMRIEEIVDPYEGTLADYDQTLNLIKSCSAGLLGQLVNEVK